MTEQMKSKIHPAMKDICEELNYFNDEFERADFKDGFTRGIKWYLKNLWHNASEKPEDIKADIIIEGDALINRCFYACCTFENPFLKWECVKRWAYLDDLLPDTLQDEMSQR